MRRQTTDEDDLHGITTNIKTITFQRLKAKLDENPNIVTTSFKGKRLLAYAMEAKRNDISREILSRYTIIAMEEVVKMCLMRHKSGSSFLEIQLGLVGALGIL